MFDGSFLTSINSDPPSPHTLLLGLFEVHSFKCMTACLSDCKMTLCLKSSKLKRITELLQMCQPARSQSVDVGQPNVISHRV